MTLPGITSKIISTPRLAIHALFSGPETGEPVIFIHGNATSSTFWEETMLALPSRYRAIALDLRGFGETEDKLIDATRGLGDWGDDFRALATALKLERYHLVGHSLGGLFVFTLAPTLGEAARSLSVVAPASPWGFGGTKGPDGEPCHADFAGSGGGLVNPEFARLMGEKNRGSDHPLASPRVVMNTYYWKPPFRAAREEALLTSVLTEKIGPQKYPGDSVPSPNWPLVAPGNFGPINATSAKFMRHTARNFLASTYRPPLLWLRGADDQVVSDSSIFDIGQLGKLRIIKGWPGEAIFPPQPMVVQTRTMLEAYRAAGGSYQEVVLTECGHTPFIEKPEAFNAALHSHLAASAS